MAHYGRNKAYRLVCKVCGKPRYEDCTYALCEAHYLEYARVKQHGYYHRRRVTASGRVLDTRPPIPFMD